MIIRKKRISVFRVASDQNLFFCASYSFTWTTKLSFAYHFRTFIINTLRDRLVKTVRYYFVLNYRLIRATYDFDFNTTAYSLDYSYYFGTNIKDHRYSLMVGKLKRTLVLTRFRLGIIYFSKTWKQDEEPNRI